jgi:hypothetical protein
VWSRRASREAAVIAFAGGVGKGGGVEGDVELIAHESDAPDFDQKMKDWFGFIKIAFSPCVFSSPSPPL